MNVKASFGPCLHARWTIPATTDTVSCLDCGLSRTSSQHDLITTRELVAAQLAKDGPGSTFTLTTGHMAALLAMIPAATDALQAHASPREVEQVVAWLRSEAAMNHFRAETCADDMVVEFDLYRQSLAEAADSIERGDHRTALELG